MLRTLRSLSLVLAVAMLMAPAAAHAGPATKKAGAATSKKAASKKKAGSKKRSSKKKSSKKKSSKKKKTSSGTYPTVSKVAPMKAGIGGKLVIKGKSYKSGKAKNYVVFKRDGGRALFVKADKATKTQITVTIPAKLLGFLLQKAGVAQPTRFHLRVMATRLAKSYTKTSLSPLISPSAGSTGAAGDCDADGVPNAKDPDDDNDLLSDTEEAVVGSDPCKRDSDGDGMSDGWEVQSAKDRNGGAYPKAKPTPNPLDKGDADIDSDGDGLTNLEEYTAWATFGGNALPLSYSGGQVASAGRYAVPGDQAYLDRDGNGFLSDFERDADGDGISNMDESRTNVNMARVITEQNKDDAGFYDFGVFTPAYIEKAAEGSKQDRCGGINQVPFYCVDQAQPSKVNVQKVDTLDWLSADTDGDGLRDDVDDVDHDGIGNLAELTAMRTQTRFKDRKFAPIDACVPSIDNSACLLSTVDIDKDGLDNAHDTDDDGDGLADTDEVQWGTDALLYDTDDDGVSDAFEFYSAVDLNAYNRPDLHKRAYPNPLDGTDADSDFDQDGLTNAEEYQAWLYTSCGVAKALDPVSCRMHFPLTYSDGKQTTDPSSGVRDGERDVDADGLTNWVESHGPLSSPKWWDEYMAQDSIKLACSSTYVESPYPGPTYQGLDFVDPDTDGDGLNDGQDDIDHDGYINKDEQTRPGLFTTESWCDTYRSTVRYAHPDPSNPVVTLFPERTGVTDRMQPFNPCKPTYSSACHYHPPLSYYPVNEDWRSPDVRNGP